MDPLESSRLLNSPWRKLARAKTHIEDLKSVILAFEQCNPYECLCEADPDIPDKLFHKIRLTRPVPDVVAEILGDAMNNLRECLDYAGYVSAVIGGRQKPTSACFPFAESAGELPGKIVWNCKHIPKDIATFFAGLQPYKGGNDLLWALSRVANANKHATLIRTTIAASHTRPVILCFHDDGSTEQLMLLKPVWNSQKQEIVFAVTEATSSTHLNCQFTISVAFDQVDIVSGQEVVTVLDQFAGIVEGILLGFEAEMRRVFPESF
jgi:hypothetical protein